jgi:hypothetical protein
MVAAPSKYVVDGPYGTGWYHVIGEDDQEFNGHGGEPDVYILDFGVTGYGTARKLGHAHIHVFEASLDKVEVLNTIGSEFGYYVTAVEQWSGQPYKDGSSLVMTFYSGDNANIFVTVATLSVDDWVPA